MSKHYRITNITKKPGAKKGKYRLGFFVDILGKGLPMAQGRYVDVTELTPGMIAFQHAGYVSIVEVPDRNIEIKKQIEEQEQKNRAEREELVRQEVKTKTQDLQNAKDFAKAAATPIEEIHVPQNSLDKQEIKNDARKSFNPATKARVSNESMDPLADVEKAINPDGEPNFIVKVRGKRK